MSEREAGFAPDLPQVSIAQVTLTSVMVILLSVLLVTSVVSESGQAIATVGFVLAEALVLYVGYGAVVRIAGPTARELLAGA